MKLFFFVAWTENGPELIFFSFGCVDRKWTTVGGMKRALCSTFVLSQFLL